MSHTSDQRSDDFLKIADQFKLGVLTTESSHPVTANLSEVARTDAAAALDLLFQVDNDVVDKFALVADSGRLQVIAKDLAQRLRAGGKVFFTGCGSTGRLSIQLDSIWRDFWSRQGNQSASGIAASDLEQRAFSVMAGGDFALIKAVEGFEDFTEFGKRQIRDLGVCDRDVVFAITEGGETSFVIGTAWEGLAAGAKVYFVYNNPDDVLCQHVQRSREIIQEPRIEKINLTTGPMAITGSTRMQATSIQLGVLLAILEMAIRDLLGGAYAAGIETFPAQFLAALRGAYATLRSPELCRELAALVDLEETVYRSGHKNNYFADAFGIDVLTDTTERSPTYCTPPFRKFDDATATESWAFLFVPHAPTSAAWRHILKRSPRCVQWSPDEVVKLVAADKVARTNEIISRIGSNELMRFRIGADALETRSPQKGGSAVCIFSTRESQSLAPEGFFHQQLVTAEGAGARTGIICVGPAHECFAVSKQINRDFPSCVRVVLPTPATDFLLDGTTRVVLKMMLNAFSTCTMVRLRRVMGNYMIWVVASNLKLIDRATRYIQKLTGIDYQAANRLLFEVVEYVEPRMKADRAYPPVVGLAVARVKHGLDNGEAEKKLMKELG